MSSNRIEPGDAGEAKPRARRLTLGDLIKQILPRSMFGRSLLILVMPLIMVQIVTTLVFYDRLWDVVMRRLAAGVAGDIALAIETMHLLPRDSDKIVYLAFANQATDLGFKLEPAALLRYPAPVQTDSLIEEQMIQALTERIHRPFQFREPPNGRYVTVSVQLPEGLLIVSVPRKRLFTSTTYIFLLWMAGTSIVTFFVAMLFLRNQVRSLRRLASAVEAFGKGRDAPYFKVEGASEVRQAAAAFQIMRERIQRQITQRTEMLAGVSHDLRTPLTRMKLELELLSDGEDIEGLRADVAEMQQMIEGYLSFARGDGNEVAQLIDLAELVQDTVATARRGGSEISLTAPASLPATVRRDALRRCLMNLISNGTRYGGYLWITVQATRTSINILIDDDGPGIPEPLREAVFRPFYRLESSRNMATGGVGLGLSIARDIIRGHGGDLTLESAPQGGLRARLQLPR